MNSLPVILVVLAIVCTIMVIRPPSTVYRSDDIQEVMPVLRRSDDIQNIQEIMPILCLSESCYNTEDPDMVCMNDGCFNISAGEYPCKATDWLYFMTKPKHLRNNKYLDSGISSDWQKYCTGTSPDWQKYCSRANITCGVHTPSICCNTQYSKSASCWCIGPNNDTGTCDCIRYTH